MRLVTQHLIPNSDFSCPLTTLFQTCPSLPEVASRVLTDGWRQRRISAHSPNELYLLSDTPGPQLEFARPLHEVLIERYCQGADIRLDAAEDWVVESPNDVSGQDIDLAKLQDLINTHGPLLIDDYRQALVDYWNTPDATARTAWQRYAGYLRQQLLNSIQRVQPGSLAPATLELAVEIASYPSAEARQQAFRALLPQVSLLSLDLHDSPRLNELSGALVIASRNTEAEPANLLFTLTGRLLVFSSRQALLRQLGDLWPSHAGKHPSLELLAVDDDAFDTLALKVFERQLQVIDRVCERHRTREGARGLSLELAHLTAMLDLCPDEEQLKTRQLADQLPQWLREGSEQQRHDYAAMLVEIAQGYADAKGDFWLHGIDDAEHYTYRKINERLHTDHPDNALAPWNIEVINHQTVAVALPTGGFSGSVTPVRYSLAQLAIGNLVLLKPGRVELRDSSGQPLPEWMNERYVRQLVTELDIGSSYPRMLQTALLDDETEKHRRQRLLAGQLRAQMPAAALELHLRSRQLSRLGVSAVREVFAPVPGKASTWVMRPLGFAAEDGARPDLALNAWLIEAARVGDIPLCLLYRPLHEQPLVEYTSRASLLAAIARPGALQNDILERLPENVRRIYANDGFNQPHLPGLLQMTFLGVPYQPPAPVTLATEPAISHLSESVYLSCVEETIAQFKAHSVTSNQARWEQWKALGWLLLNTVLPLAGGTLAKAIWLIQIGVALGQYLQTSGKRDPSEHRIALVNLLVNVALAVFAHTLPRMNLDKPPAQIAETPTPLPISSIDDPQATRPHLELNWSSADLQLAPSQRQALARLRSSRPTGQLGAVIESGHWQGLHQLGETYWLTWRGGVYRVMIDEALEQARIIGDSEPQALGPWLRRGENGHWELDLRLRLRGGMRRNPRGKLQAQRLERAQRRETLHHTINDQDREGPARIARLIVLDSVIKQDERLTTLESQLPSIRDTQAFWNTLERNLKEYHELQPMAEFHDRLATAVFQQFFSKSVLHTVLIKLIRLKRQAFTEHLNTAPGERAGSWPILDDLNRYVNELVPNSQGMRDTVRGLERLASPRHAHAQALYQRAQRSLRAPIEELILSTHLLRLETNWRRFSLQPDLPERVPYLLERSWKNLGLAISQRLKLFDMPNASEELSARLLRDIDSQFGFALRRMENLRQELGDHPTASQVLDDILQDITFAADGIKADLQDYPPVSTVEQLRQATPGLIETPSHGLLLGQPREGDETLIDILDNEQRPLLTFRKQEDEWLPVDQPTPQVAPPPAPVESLGQLFEQLDALTLKANKTLDFLHSKAAINFFPVEFEELLDNECKPLRALQARLDTRLASETDLSPAASELHQARINQLRSLLATLGQQAIELRTQATLRQKPRLEGLAFLVEHEQVQIRQTGRRRPLSAVAGRAQDYLDEYLIEHDDRPLWYAHFHYAKVDDAKQDFIAGHLKTAEQRLLKGQSFIDPVTQQRQVVYRAPITRAAARRYFFKPLTP